MDLPEREYQIPRDSGPKSFVVLGMWTWAGLQRFGMKRLANHSGVID